MTRTVLLTLVLLALLVLVVQGLIPWWVALVALIAYLVRKRLLQSSTAIG